MIRFNAVALLIFSAVMPAMADAATLRWSNGDSLSGTLLKADENSLTWQSPMFTDPLQIELSYLASVQFPASEAAKSDEAEFQILMRNGDLLSGRLKSMTETSMSFESERFGSFEVAQDQIFSLQRAEKFGMIYSGPRGLDQWQDAWRRPANVNNGIAIGFGGGLAAPLQQADTSPLKKADRRIWSEEPDGSISTRKADAALFLPLELPDKFEIEFEVRSTMPLSFLMAIGRNAKSNMRIETWVDVLVVAERTAFQTLRTIGEKDLSVHLYAFVNLTDHTMQVYSETGEKLDEISIVQQKADANGLMFRNGDFDLSIRRVRVSHWDGKTPRIVSGDNSRIELNDGTLHFGKVEAFDPQTGNLTLTVEEDTIRVSVADVGSLVVSSQSVPSTAERGSMWLTWSDGGFVSGSLVSVANGTAVMQTPYLHEQLQCRMNNLVSMGLTTSGSDLLCDEKLAAYHLSNQDAADLEKLIKMKKALHRREAQLDAKDPAAKKIREAIKRVDKDLKNLPETIDPTAQNQNDQALQTQPDRLFHEHGTLQGRLVVDGAAEAPIQWTPLGGLNSSTLQGVENARFVRASDVMHLSETPALLAAFPDVVYLRNNDVLPCRIEASTEEGIQFTSPLTEVRSFTRDYIRAVELSAAGRIHQSGFDAEGWKGFSSKQTRTGRTSLVFRGNVQYSHPEILTGDTVRFRLEWPKQSWASLTVSMFGTGQRDDEGCTHVCFSLMPNQMQILDRPMQQNQMMMGVRMGGRQGGQANDGLVSLFDSQAEIQIVAHDGNIVVSVDGQPVKTIKLNSSSPGRRGIAFNANVTAVGRVIVNGQVAQGAGDGVTLSNFEVDNLSGASIRQFIEEESRQAALTVPRFRRDSPPTHVLIAPNGDLLRGRLLGIEGDKVVFESRLETLRFDRSRVGAIVWLDAPKKADTKPADAGEASAASGETATSTPAAISKPASDADGFAVDNEDETNLQAQLADGFSITMKPLRLVDGRIEGSSALLGKCSFPARSVRELLTGDPKTSQRLVAYDTWITTMAREPDWDIPQSDGGNSEASALIGKAATDFELPMLDGTTFKLSDHQDKIVVLDFWATWCGPCVMALPDYIAATSKFEESKVIFVAVNLQESSDEIRSFLMEKQLSPRVALDRSADVAPKFQVSGIPHTVILGPGNIIEDVHVGYQPGSGEAMQTTLQQMLDGTWQGPTEQKPVE